MKDIITRAQERLIQMGYLDPPADGVAGVISHWALRATGYKGTPTAENAEDILKQLEEMDELPLKPGDDLAGKIIKAMQKKGYWIARYPACVNIVYVEGMDPSGKPNKNEPNQFNDLRTVIRIEKDGTPKILGKWEATTEPGKYFTQNPMNPAGAARLAFGQYKAWSMGYHHASKGKNHQIGRA